MDFFLTTDIAPTNILAASSDGRYNMANAEETGLLGFAKALLPKPITLYFHFMCFSHRELVDGI